jgi:hypothetical protein
MNKNFPLLIIRFSGALLFITAIAKLASAVGGARILQIPHPIVSISFRDMFWIAGLLELVVAFVCFFSKQIGLQAGLVAWLATSFLIYRLGLLWVGYHKPCSCLGNLTDALHIPPQTADTTMKIILAYLLIGSYGTLFWLWKEKRKIRITAPSVAETIKSVS